MVSWLGGRNADCVLGKQSLELAAIRLRQVDVSLVFSLTVGFCLVFILTVLFVESMVSPFRQVIKHATSNN